VADEVEDRVTALAHAPVPVAPLTLVTVTLVHVAVTAEAGTVVQPVNVDEPAWIPRVQSLLVEPLISKTTVEADDPATNPRSGSVAEKLIVDGVAVMDVTLVA
jgi:hypothetical protein